MLGVEFRSLDREWLDTLAVEDILNRGLNRFENSANVRGTVDAKAGGNPGLDHLAHVVVKLNQVDKDRPLNLQQEILLVVLKLGMETVDHSLASRLRAQLAFKRRLEHVEPPAQLLAQSLDRIEHDRRFGRRGAILILSVREPLCRDVFLFRQAFDDLQAQLIAHCRQVLFGGKRPLAPRRDLYRVCRFIIELGHRPILSAREW